MGVGIEYSELFSRVASPREAALFYRIVVVLLHLLAYGFSYCTS